MVNVRHRDGKGLDAGGDAQRLTGIRQVLRSPKLLRAAAGVDKIQILKDPVHLLVCHMRSFLVTMVCFVQPSRRRSPRSSVERPAP